VSTIENNIVQRIWGRNGFFQNHVKPSFRYVSGNPRSEIPETMINDHDREGIANNNPFVSGISLRGFPETHPLY